MLKRRLVSLSLLGLLSGLASAANFIREWTGASGYRIVEMTVWIDAPGTYKFEALDVDPNDPNTVLGLGWIDRILLSENCPAGTVNLYVLRDPNEGGGPGAAGVGEINLKKTGVTTNIMDVSTSVNLAYLGMIQADTIGGEVETGAIQDDIVIDALSADAILGCTGSPFAHHLTVSGDLAGYAYFLSLDQNSQVSVTGELSGILHTFADMRGLIVADVVSGSIEVVRDFVGGS